MINRDAYLDSEIEKETDIKKLEKEIAELDNSIEEYKETIKKMEDSIKNKEVELMKYVDLLNQKNISFEETEKENTRLAKAEAELKKQLEDSKNSESNLIQRCNTLQQEKNKLEEHIKALEKGLNDLEDEDKRVKRELEDLSNKILSLEDTKTALEKDNASLKEDLKNYNQENEALIEKERSRAEELRKEINTVKKRGPELASCIKNIKENAFKLTEGKFSVIEQIIIKTGQRVIDLDKRFKSVTEKISEAKDKSKEEKSPNIDIAQGNQEEEDKVGIIKDNQKEKQGLPLSNIKQSINEFEASKNEAHDPIASELKAIKEGYKKVNQRLYQGKLELIKKVGDCNKIIETKLIERIELKESTISNLSRLKDVIRKLKIEAEKKAMIVEYLYIEKDGTRNNKEEDNLSPVLVNKVDDDSKEEQSPSTEIDITKEESKMGTKEDDQEEKEEQRLNTLSIIRKFKDEFEFLKKKTQNLLANEAKVIREVMIKQFKEICELIYKRELKLVKKIEDSYDIGKEKLSTIINMGNEVTSKVNKLKSLMTKAKSKVRTIAKD